LRGKIVEFVSRGDFGLASGPNPDGTYERIWYPGELVPPDEVAFEAGVLLLKKARAQALKAKPAASPGGAPGPGEAPGPAPEPSPEGEAAAGPAPGTSPGPAPEPTPTTAPVRVAGTVPPELWNRLGTKVLPKLRTLKDFRISVALSASAEAGGADELRGNCGKSSRIWG